MYAHILASILYCHFLLSNDNTTLYIVRYTRALTYRSLAVVVVAVVLTCNSFISIFLLLFFRFDW